MIAETGNSKGFTLLELLVVLAILALLTTALPMALDRALPRQQLKVAAQDLAVALRALREEATTQGITTEIESSAAGVVAYRDRRSGDSENVTSNARATIRSAQVVAHAEERIRFFPDGTTTGGEITLHAGEHAQVVWVSALTGRIEVRP